MKPAQLLWFLLVLTAVLPCSAQPALQGVLTITNQRGYMFSMELLVQNVGNATYTYNFPNSEMCYYSVDGQDYHEMSLPVVLPFELAAGDSVTFDMHHTSVLSSGTHVVQAHFNTSDPLAIGNPVNIIVAPEVHITAGTGDDEARVPIDFFWRSSLYECVYTAAELQHQPGTLTAISFYPEFVTMELIPEIKIYLANTPLADLAYGWFRALDMFWVLTDNVAFPINQPEVRIELQGGFHYNGQDNLVMMVFRPIPSDYGFHGDPFRAFAADPLRSRLVYTDSYTFNPNNPPAAQPSQHFGFIPQATFHMIPTGPSGTEDEHIVPQAPKICVYPNPSRDNCTIKVEAMGRQSSQVEIYNLKGQMIRKLDIDNDINGEVAWDTRDQAGKQCAAGIYMYKVNCGYKNSIGRLVLVR